MSERQGRRLDRDEQATLENREARPFDDRLVGRQRKSGPEPESDPLPETDDEGQDEGQEQEDEDESDRQSEEGNPRPVPPRLHSPAPPGVHAALKRAHSDS